jgi:hypothetical protein
MFAALTAAAGSYGCEIYLVHPFPGQLVPAGQTVQSAELPGHCLQAEPGSAQVYRQPADLC